MPCSVTKNEQTNKTNKSFPYLASSLHNSQESEKGSEPDSVSTPQPLPLPPIVILMSQGGYRAWRCDVCGQHGTRHFIMQSMPSSFFLWAKRNLKRNWKSVALEKFEKKPESVWEGICSASAWAVTLALVDSDSWHQAQFDLSAVAKPISQRERDLSHVPFSQFLRVGKRELIWFFISWCFKEKDGTPECFCPFPHWIPLFSLKGFTKILLLLSFFPVPYPFTELLFFHSAVSNVFLSFKE